MIFQHYIPQGLIGDQPVAQLIRKTARKEWKLIALNFASSILAAVSEGATLGIIFIIVQVLSLPRGATFDWASLSFIRYVPHSFSWLTSLPSWAALSLLVSLAVLFQALFSICNFLTLLSVGFFAARCKAMVTSRIYSQVMSLSFPCASGYKIGDLADHIGQGPDGIRTQIELQSKLIVGFLLCATYLAILTSISPWLLLAVFLMAGIIITLQWYLLPGIARGSQAIAEVQVATNSRITEDFQALRLLHTSGQLDESDRNVRIRMDQLESILRSQVLKLSIVAPFSSFLPIVAISLIAILSLLVFGNRTTGILPSLITFVLALQRLAAYMNGIAGIFNQLADNSARLSRLNQILSPEGKSFRRKGGIQFYELNRDICFNAVDLRYSSELSPALSEIDFTLAKGMMLALVGPSGSGKSSIADLLIGLYRPTSGKILIDGIPLDHLDLASWQNRLGVVSQDTFLFNATVAENIAYGSSGITFDQLKDACVAAQAFNFIDKLPQGFNTILGERGYRLSGGQRQRLSLARAILRNPEVLILDEATSALDSHSERLVQEAIESLEGHQTILVIAHRLSTIQKADHILVLNSGRIVQSGSHENLVSVNGFYKDLWVQQSLQKLAI